ncbi:hypothetical protein DPEC_G00234600 [Dallia pectoralis]|uniref:Uncharacterized protein n=1 Tax=Dallia pectoralis TaxID=75939 RepID=A0ACC2FY27_DALPE|nr:hypothetical protein DPEC_G00234600 [Dallia pectoralis]
MLLRRPPHPKPCPPITPPPNLSPFILCDCVWALVNRLCPGNSGGPVLAAGAIVMNTLTVRAPLIPFTPLSVEECLSSEPPLHSPSTSPYPPAPQPHRCTLPHPVPSQFHALSAWPLYHSPKVSHRQDRNLGQASPRCPFSARSNPEPIEEPASGANRSACAYDRGD